MGRLGCNDAKLAVPNAVAASQNPPPVAQPCLVCLRASTAFDAGAQNTATPSLRSSARWVLMAEMLSAAASWQVSLRPSRPADSSATAM